MDEQAPDAIGPPRLVLRVDASLDPAPPFPRVLRAVLVGLLFSVFPVLLTSVVLTREATEFDPQALTAAIPVVATSVWLSRPRDRWYAVGADGFALGERFFGQVRWELCRFGETTGLRIEILPPKRGDDDHVAYRFTFEGSQRVVVEGRARGTPGSIPSAKGLSHGHELVALRAAADAYERATGRAPEGAELLIP